MPTCVLLVELELPIFPNTSLSSSVDFFGLVQSAMFISKSIDLDLFPAILSAKGFRVVSLVLVFLLLILFSLKTWGQPFPVGTKSVGELLSYPEKSAPASVVSLNEGTVGAEVAAAIDRILVRVGDIVDAGENLVELDCSAYALAEEEIIAQQKSSEAERSFASSQLDRARQLLGRGGISRETVDERQSRFLALSAEQVVYDVKLRHVRRDIERCQVRSPYRALVLERLVIPGGYAVPGTPLLRLVDIGQVEVGADILVSDVEEFVESQLLFRYEEQEYPLLLRALLPLVDNKTRTRKARLTFDTVDGALVGSSGRLVWRDSRGVLPPSTLVRREGQLGVLIAEEGYARFHPLEGAREGRPVAPKGLSSEKLVIVEGHLNLIDGDPVAIGGPVSTTSLAAP